MYIRFTALLPIAALVAVAAAAPNALEVRQNSVCDTGSLQCCAQTFTANNPGSLTLQGLSVVVPVGALIGLACNPISVISEAQGALCDQQTVCCSNNTFEGGLINVGCSPITYTA